MISKLNIMAKSIYNHWSYNSYLFSSHLFNITWMFKYETNKTTSVCCLNVNANIWWMCYLNELQPFEALIVATETTNYCIFDFLLSKFLILYTFELWIYWTNYVKKNNYSQLNQWRLFVGCDTTIVNVCIYKLNKNQNLYDSLVINFENIIWQ